MWDEFKDYPDAEGLREPDDYEYEPTPHDDVLEKAKQHYPRAAEHRSRRESGAARMSVGFHELEEAPPPMTSRLDGELLEISMGPQHPSTHGVFRMNVALDGETVVKLKPVFGYLHRNHEKIGENTSYLGSMPYTDRLDYFCSMTNNWAYALSVEKLAGHRSAGARGIYPRHPRGADAPAKSHLPARFSAAATWARGARR